MAFLTKSSLDKNRKNLLSDFQKKNNLHFRNIDLLNLAFTHRSVTNENSSHSDNNERLEFLGDAILGMVTAGYLFEKFNTSTEGELAKIKSAVVSEAALSEIALNQGIDKCLLLGKGEEHTGGRHKKAILADCVEAVIGAYYLDSGYKAAQKFILDFMIKEIDGYDANSRLKDFKTELQEFCQKKYKICPTYEIVKKTGPDHDKTFWMSVNVNGNIFGPARGKNKKEAEQAAASIACKSLIN
jgi:ribonuclease-3